MTKFKLVIDKGERLRHSKHDNRSKGAPIFL